MPRILAAAIIAGASLSARASDLQGLTEAEARELYHLAEGSEGIPYLWLRALESPVTRRPFLEQPERFGLLPDPAHPDGLAVGLATAAPRDLQFAHVKMLGVTCASCHVGEVRHGGKSMRIIGGPSFFQTRKFSDEVQAAIRETIANPKKLMAFGHRVIELKKHDPRAAALAVDEKHHAGVHALDDTAREHLAQALQGKKGAKEKLKAIGAKLDPRKQVAKLEDLLHAFTQTARMLKDRADLMAASAAPKDAVPVGPGRVDAFGTLLHRLYAKQGVPAPYAPVSFPEVWDASRTPWYHYDGNTDSIVERNAGNARGLGFVFDPKTYATTLLPRSLHRAETLFWKTRPPVWPAAMLGAIDPAKKERGAQIYAQKCAACHEQKTFQLVELSAVGTDPARARTTLAQVKGQQALVAATNQNVAILATAYQQEKVAAAEQESFRFGRPAKATWRGTGKYKIPSLRGVWATAPYLHNGSVPTLHDLLTPALQRPKKFLLGSYEFDPVKVGFVTKASDAIRFEYDTSVAGNRNTGHEFGTDLPAADRAALVEYLKAL